MDDRPVGVAAPAISPCSSLLGFSSFEIGADRWGEAEKVAYEVIRKIQPTQLSEETRRQVIVYVQGLIRKCIGAEVFPYGSVPLKTYLRDGDVDLTAIGGANIEDKLADEIKFVLEEEEKNRASEFVVKDVQLIRAEVKLVKCIVQDIVVDVSLNQIGGLSTLCFLEQVDRLIGKDHLFKHSIILIKAWCYYESRILGAHHGLISTYALEIMVLYIFQFFHSTLDGPLAVLYKFLDYFSKFDWEAYCVSLKGPVHLSSYRAVEAEMPEDSCGDLLLSSDFSSACVKLFSIPSKDININSRGFQQKHLNIVDPLKESNNLGRSVSKGNFYRIRSAFSFGALKLGRILLQPEYGVANELHQFFSNTLSRHGCGQIPDVLALDLPPACNGLISYSPVLETELCKIDKLSDDNRIICSNSTEGDCMPSSSESSQDVNVEVGRISDVSSGEQTSTLKLSHSHHEDANNLAPSGVEELRISSDSVEASISVLRDSACVTARPVFAPHLFFSKSAICNGSMRNGDSDSCDEGEGNDSHVLSSGFVEEKVAVAEYVDSKELMNKNEVVASTNSNDIFLDPKLSDLSGDIKCDQASVSRIDTPESLNSLFDFTGDYESYLYSLEYSRWCYEYASVVPSFPVPPPPPPARPQFPGNGFSHWHPNSFHPSSPMYAPHVLLPPMAFGWNEMPKPRGTGTYFPNTNQPPQGYRSSVVKGRNHFPSSTYRNGGQNTIFMESNMQDRRCHEPAQYQSPVDQSLNDGSSGSEQQPSPNGSALAVELEPDRFNEFGVQHAFKASILERNKKQRPVSSSPRSFPGMRMPQPASIKEQDRIALGSLYRLKDEDDFPPLSV